MKLKIRVTYDLQVHGKEEAFRIKHLLENYPNIKFDGLIKDKVLVLDEDYQELSRP